MSVFECEAYSLMISAAARYPRGWTFLLPVCPRVVKTDEGQPFLQTLFIVGGETQSDNSMKVCVQGWALAFRSSIAEGSTPMPWRGGQDD